MKIRLLLAAALCVSAPAFAQEAAKTVAPAQAAAAPAPNSAAEPSEDEMADLLNSRQQLKQDVTLQRSVDGKVIETRKETVIYDHTDPLRSSESAVAPLDRLRAAFDQEALTRREALREAELDFALADKDRNGWLTEAEFGDLVHAWREGDVQSAALGKSNRAIRFVDFHDGLAEEAADNLAVEEARQKYAAMVAGRGALTKREFMREVSAAFDKFDADQNGLLRETELIAFRASARGEVDHEGGVEAAPLPAVATPEAEAVAPLKSAQ
jgi:Ca2+-binding EF-hand superfamily protein